MKNTSTSLTVKSPSAPPEDWMAEDDMRTLMRAEEIRKDSKRLAAAKAMAKKKLAEIQAVADTPKK